MEATALWPVLHDLTRCRLGPQSTAELLSCQAMHRCGAL